MKKPDVDKASQDFESIFNITDDGIVCIDRDGIILRVNPALAKILSYEEHELPGKPFIALLYKEQQMMQRLFSKNFFATRLQMAEKSSLEIILFDKNGHDVPVRFRTIIRRDRQGRIKEAIGMITRIDELTGIPARGTSLADKMWEAQHNLENVINNSADAILITDITGNIMTANNALCDTLGYIKDETIGMHAVEIASFEGTYDSTTGEKITIDEEYTKAAADKQKERWDHHRA